MRLKKEFNIEFTIKQHGGDGWGVEPFLTKTVQKTVRVLAVLNVKYVT